MKVLKLKVEVDGDITEDTPIRDIDAGYHFNFVEYVEDENGRKGAKFIAEGSKGYDFEYDDEEVTLFPGDIYNGSWSYEEIEGPSEWEEVFKCYQVQLVEVEE